MLFGRISGLCDSVKFDINVSEKFAAFTYLKLEAAGSSEKLARMYQNSRCHVSKPQALFIRVCVQLQKRN
jgi:hypothetical protein